MKTQDILFIVVFVLLLLVKKQKLFTYAGLISLAGAIPLFAAWIFFTAERLTMYAAAFFLAAIFI